MKNSFRIAEFQESTRNKHHLVYKYKKGWKTICSILVTNSISVYGEYRGVNYPNLCKNCTNELEMQRVLKDLIDE